MTIKQCFRLLTLSTISLILGMGFLSLVFKGWDIVPVYDKNASNSEISAIVSRLARCESSNRWDIRVMDSNNQYSYGGLQFQIKTVEHYAKKYGYDLEPQEIPNVIYEPAFQRALAADIITNEKDGLKNWYLCSRKLHLL